MGDVMKDLIKLPKQIGNKVFVYNLNNELIHVYTTLELGKDYFSMSNDEFFNHYGFNFIPSGVYYKLSKKAAGK